MNELREKTEAPTAPTTAPKRDFWSTKLGAVIAVVIGITVLIVIGSFLWAEMGADARDSAWCQERGGYRQPAGNTPFDGCVLPDGQVVVLEP